MSQSAHIPPTSRESNATSTLAIEPVLELRDLSIALPKGADREHAVHKVSLKVYPGEIVCLVGESGSGKSVIAFSTMGLLAKALPIAGGQIILQGEDITRATEARLRELRCKKIGMIFQEPMTALNPVMKCGDQIDEVLREHTSRDSATRRHKVLEMIKQVHLPEPERMYESYPHQLSGGQRQRIMIAMALILEPVLLIADEPTTALDVTTQAQILKLIRELQGERQTGVLFITHDFGVVADIADRVAVLKYGELVELGGKAQMLQNPQHEYTKMLIAAVPSPVPPVQSEDFKAKLAASPVVLRTENLGKTYKTDSLFGGKRTVDAAKNVSIEIRKGQTVGIVGESGSGKSTVARCIARLIEPSAGQIHLVDQEIAHRSVGDMRALRQKVQIVFQDPYRSLNPRRTVGESIVEGPMNYGKSKAEAFEQAKGLMSLVRLDPNSLDRYPHQFSGGQRQRICIARALAMNPELLICDEAVSALDVSVQAQVLKLIEELQAKLNLAILFITHDLRVAAQICDQVVVMSKGEIVEYGPTSELFGRPQHAYTKALFEAAPGRGMKFADAA
jgi:peptide/nickel transport system ATP-binding protein